jgi:predicted alpha/beta-fold hydrolase
VGAIAALHPGIAPWVIGFSLGGNFALRVAASADSRVGPLAGVIAVSPVLHPDSAMRAMEQGMPLYQRYFVHKWSRSLQRKQQLWRPGLVREDIYGYGDLRRMTEVLVADHTSFPRIQDYLDGYAITGGRLNSLKCPATLLAALDDPIIPAADLALLARPSNLRIVTTEKGGHMGFVTSPFASSWVNDFVLKTMALPLRQG